MMNKTAYIHIPKSWLDYQKFIGRLEPKIVKGKEVYYLDMIIDKDITLKVPGRPDISLSKP